MYEKRNPQLSCFFVIYIYNDRHFTIQDSYDRNRQVCSCFSKYSSIQIVIFQLSLELGQCQYQCHAMRRYLNNLGDEFGVVLAVVV